MACRGAVVAGVMFFLPAFMLLSLLAGVYLAFGDVPLVQGIFYGIRPAVVAVVLFAAWRIGSRALKNEVLWGMAALAFIGIFFFDIGFPWIVLAAGHSGRDRRQIHAGKIQERRRPWRLQQGNTARRIIDDDTPPPAHAKFSWGKLVVTTLVFVAIWLAAMLAISGQHDLYDMGEFFTKAAFLTIGGAYAVLPYVYQGGVEHFGWLTGPQMMDGLALGETTPGPLIMIVTWVGYHRRRGQGSVRQPDCRRSGRRGGGDLLYLPAVVLVHHCRRAAGRSHARRNQIHRAAHRHHRRRGRRDSQSGGVFCLAHLLAAGRRRPRRLRAPSTGCRWSSPSPLLSPCGNTRPTS